MWRPQALGLLRFGALAVAILGTWRVARVPAAAWRRATTIRYFTGATGPNRRISIRKPTSRKPTAASFTRCSRDWSRKTLTICIPSPVSRKPGMCRPTAARTPSICGTTQNGATATRHITRFRRILPPHPLAQAHRAVRGIFLEGRRGGQRQGILRRQDHRFFPGRLPCARRLHAGHPTSQSHRVFPFAARKSSVVSGPCADGPQIRGAGRKSHPLDASRQPRQQRTIRADRLENRAGDRREEKSLSTGTPTGSASRQSTFIRPTTSTARNAIFAPGCFTSPTICP